jgi:hypothetical protein
VDAPGGQRRWFRERRDDPAEERAAAGQISLARSGAAIVDAARRVVLANAAGRAEGLGDLRLQL